MRKKNRDLILEYLEKCLVSHQQGASTSDISKALQMQRTNVSKLLNELIGEGLVEKEAASYPVIYKRTEYNFYAKEKQPFSSLIGCDGSLKRAVQLAKSAILYPNKSLNMLILAKPGTGKSLFVRKIFEFAKEVGACEENAPFVKLNCLYYKDNIQELSLKFEEKLSASKKGFFYIEHFHLLDAESKTKLSALLDSDDTSHEVMNDAPIIVCSMPPLMGSEPFFDNITSKISIIISLPELKERGLAERFAFIKKFFCNEANESSCDIRVTSEVLIALLLYSCENIKHLFHDIRQACAGAYSRELENKDRTIHVLITDFSNHVRSGLLNYKNLRMDVDAIIQEASEYVFNADDLSILDHRQKENETIYEWINTKRNELYKRGFSSSEVSTVVNVGIETEINKYRKNMLTSAIDKEQLSQLVDAKVIELVDQLLLKAGSKLNRYFSVSVNYGLCLHVQALIERRGSAHPIKIEKMMEFIEKNKEEYALAMTFGDQLSEVYELELPVDEIVIIAMFLCGHNSGENQNEHPSLLIAMHGVGIAKALAETMKLLLDVSVYFYDLSLSKKPLDAYEDIKQSIFNIPHERGVLVVYDMGSLKDIFNMVAIETGIMIKMIELPVTLILMDLCRKLMLADTLQNVYEDLADRFKLLDNSADYETKKKCKAIVSFCMSGEGGAIQIKKYIEEHFVLDGVEVISLQLAQQSLFLQELNKISKEREILCIIGTFNPNIYGIPFIPIEHVFANNNHSLSQLLDADTIKKQDFFNNSETIFKHLAKELTHIDVEEVKEKVIGFILDIEKELGASMEMNEKIGLLVHITCAIDRLKAGYTSAINPLKEEVIKKNMVLYRMIAKRMIEFEKMYGITISDDEICNIIYIVKQSRVS